MDRIPLKLRLRPELVKKLKEIHPSYGELSRVVGELLEAYVKVRERHPTTDQTPIYVEAIKLH